MPHLTRAAIGSLVATILLVAGCSKGPEKKLRGKWIGDRIDNVGADEVARATGWVKGTTFEFAGDKLTVTIPAEQPRKGTFQVTKVDGEKMTLAVTRDDSTQDLATLTLFDDKTLRWDIGSDRDIVLVRAQ